MGWDGAGGYNRQRNFSADASAGIKILASAMDQEIDDIASAFTLCLARDGQNTPTGNLSLGGNRLINVGAAQSVSDFIRAREVIENVPIYMTDNRASTDYVSVSAQFFTSVSAGQAPAGGTRILVQMGNEKASGAHMIFQGHSANIGFMDGTRIDGLVSGATYEFIYNSADSLWETPNRDLIPRTPAESKHGVVPTNVNEKPGNIVRYGAVADSGVTDNTTAINNALAVSHAHPCYIPAPESDDYYGFTGDLNFPDENGFTIVGDGERSIIRQETAGANGLGNNTGSRHFNATLRDFRIGMAAGKFGGIGINLEDISDFYCSNVDVMADDPNEGFRTPWRIYSTTGKGSYRGLFVGCDGRAEPNAASVALLIAGDSGESSNSHKWIGGSLRADSGIGVSIPNNGGGSAGVSNQNVVEGCAFEGSTATAISAQGGSSVSQANAFIANRFEGVTTAFSFDANTVDNLTIGNFFASGVTPYSDSGENAHMDFSSHSSVGNIMDVLRGHYRVQNLRDTSIPAFIGLLTDAAHPAFGAQVSGDSTLRIEIRADGQIEWSDGSSASDIALDRVAANELDFNDGQFRKMTLTDGVTAPSAVSGQAFIYVDTSDGDLKVRFGDGTTKTIATDT